MTSVWLDAGPQNVSRVTSGRENKALGYMLPVNSRDIISVVDRFLQHQDGRKSTADWVFREVGVTVSGEINTRQPSETLTRKRETSYSSPKMLHRIHTTAFLHVNGYRAAAASPRRGRLLHPVRSIYSFTKAGTLRQ